TSIDQQSWATAFQLLSGRIMGIVTHKCIEGVLAQPASCTFNRMVNVGTPMQRQVGTLPTCDPVALSSVACVALVSDASCYISGTSFAICYNGYDPTNPGNGPDGPNEAMEGEVVVTECAVKCGN